jgi:hypothetical protein
MPWDGRSGGWLVLDGREAERAEESEMGMFSYMFLISGLGVGVFVLFGVSV